MLVMLEFLSDFGGRRRYAFQRMTLDLDLLKRFERDHSQDAFTDLVKRHVNLVYSAALRQVRSPQLAEEITQSVFADLARNVGKLKADTVLTAWLYQVARRTAIDVVRKESRRQLREQIAMEMNTMNATASDWTQIEPLLDDALDALDETDRAAILLRYFENKNLREVGESLKISDDAAQKRVSRALERLREFFTSRNVTIGASGLAVLISANAVQSAPIGLVATISAAAVLTGTTLSTSTVIAATKTIAMTTLQKTLITAALVATIGTGVFEAHQAAQLRAQNQILQGQQAPLTAQIQQLQQELNDATNRLASLIAENGQWEANSNKLALLELRGEVARLLEANRQLSAGTNDANESLVKSWLAREAQLKQSAQQYPGKAIPEFQLLSEQQWLDAAMDDNFDTDTNIQKDLAALRHMAENNFASQAASAFTKYLQANNNQSPTDLSQLQPYFSPPMDDAILQRWEIAPASVDPNNGVGDPIITEISAVDASLDSRWAIGPNGYGSSSYVSSEVSDAVALVKPAMQAYAAANNGLQPTDPSQILPYLTTPAQQAAYQTLLKSAKANAPQ
jgi:RNA polymerase sigma factor (sigma-70 family)